MHFLNATVSWQSMSGVFTAVKLHSIGLLILIGFPIPEPVYFHSAELNYFFNQAPSIYLFILNVYLVQY